jgi:hypothetical protein
MVDYNKEEDKITMKVERGKSPKESKTKEPKGGDPPTEE